MLTFMLFVQQQIAATAVETGRFEGDRGRDILEDAVIACWTQIAHSRSRRGQYLSSSGRELI